MRLKQKRKHDSRHNLCPFIVGWAAIYLAAIFLLSSVSGVLTGNYDFFGQAHWVVFYTVLSALQLLWIRHNLRISLRHWLPLALLGVIVGELAFQIFDANVAYPFPPKLWSNSPNRMPQPEHIMQLKYTVYNVFRFFLLWSTPLIFQWIALRKRFRQHGLWLLAALAHAPLTFVITENGGILVQALKLFDKLTELSLIRDAQPLGSIAFLLDMATPTMIMGLALYWLLTQGEKIKTDQFRAHQRKAGK